MFKRILVSTDGSRTATQGLDTAIKLAREQEAALYVLYVVDGRAVTHGLEMDGLGATRIIGALRANGKRVLSNAEARALRAGLKPQIVLDDRSLRGVADTIVRHARRWRADLVVLGTHGRRGISRMVMGSDAEEVVRSAPAPVLLVRSAAGRRAGGR